MNAQGLRRIAVGIAAAGLSGGITDSVASAGVEHNNAGAFKSSIASQSWLFCAALMNVSPHWCLDYYSVPAACATAGADWENKSLDLTAA